MLKTSRIMDSFSITKEVQNVKIAFEIFHEYIDCICAEIVFGRNLKVS